MRYGLGAEILDGCQQTPAVTDGGYSQFHLQHTKNHDILIEIAYTAIEAP